MAVVLNSQQKRLYDKIVLLLQPLQGAMIRTQFFLLRERLYAIAGRDQRQFRHMLNDFLRDTGKVLRSTDVQGYYNLEEALGLVKTEDDCFPAFVQALQILSQRKSGRRSRAAESSPRLDKNRQMLNLVFAPPAPQGGPAEPPADTAARGGTPEIQGILEEVYDVTDDGKDDCTVAQAPATLQMLAAGPSAPQERGHDCARPNSAPLLYTRPQPPPYPETQISEHNIRQMASRTSPKFRQNYDDALDDLICSSRRNKERFQQEMSNLVGQSGVLGTSSVCYATYTSEPAHSETPLQKYTIGTITDITTTAVNALEAETLEPAPPSPKIDFRLAYKYFVTEYKAKWMRDMISRAYRAIETRQTVLRRLSSCRATLRSASNLVVPAPATNMRKKIVLLREIWRADAVRRLIEAYRELEYQENAYADAVSRLSAAITVQDAVVWTHSKYLATYVLRRFWVELLSMKQFKLRLMGPEQAKFWRTLYRKYLGVLIHRLQRLRTCRAEVYRIQLLYRSVAPVAFGAHRCHASVIESYRGQVVVLRQKIEQLRGGVEEILFGLRELLARYAATAHSSPRLWWLRLWSAFYASRLRRALYQLTVLRNY